MQGGAVKQGLVHGRRWGVQSTPALVLHLLATVLVCAAFLPPRLVGQSSYMEMQRRRVDLQSRIRPAGIGLPRISVQATLHRLEHLPELERAVALSALEEPGSAPFHLHGTLDWTSDTGQRSTATLEEDWYNDRWSRIVLAVDGVRSRRFVLDGQRRVDDEMAVVPFTLRRLLGALYDPLGDVEQVKAKMPAENIILGGQTLRCISLPGQPPPTNGLVRLPRSVCTDEALGDLRVEAGGYGIRTVWNEIQQIGRRRVATSIQVLHGDALIGTLHLDELRIAGELSPGSFAGDAADAAKLPATEPQERLMATPAETRGDLASLDAHLIPVTEDAVRKHSPVTIARVLVGPDGRLADLEVLSSSTDGLRQKTIAVLTRAYFRQRTWNGKRISTEGLLIMGLP